MADNSRKLPRRPRGASFNSFPPCLPSHHKLEGRVKKNVPGARHFPQRVRLAITKKRGKVRFFTDLSSGHHKRPLGFETAEAPG
jgi:hypothetical protein